MSSSSPHPSLLRQGLSLNLKLEFSWLGWKLASLSDLPVFTVLMITSVPLSVAQVGPEFMSQSPKCWPSKHAPPGLAINWL